MKQLLSLFIFTFCFSSKAVFATCTILPESTFYYTNIWFVIGTASHKQDIGDTPSTNPSGALLSNCQNTHVLNRVRVKSYFIAATGNTDLTGSSPFGIAPTVSITSAVTDTATLDAAKAWLANNIKIAFRMNDTDYDVGTPGQNILSLDRRYDILPETSAGNTVLNNSSELFSVGRDGTGGLSSVGIRRSTMTISYLNNSKPPIAVINALHNGFLRVHLGTYFMTYAPASDLRTASETTGSTELYEQIRLRFNVPTCTMADKNLNLPNISTGVLKDQPASNEHDFTITINCGVALTFENTIKATITDSYTADNKNDNGILKNNPTLLNRSNVDIQLKDAQSIPLTIGSERLFHRIAWDEPATIFSKTLKANYYRSEPSATPGYVQTQATVLLDYD